MKASRLYICILLLMCAAPAQAQLSLAIQMDPNPSPYVSDWRSNPNTIRFIVTNSSRVEIPVRFDGYIEGDARGRVAQTNLDAAIPPVMIPPGTITLNAVDAYIIEEGVVTYVGSTRAETRRSGRLPEDDFRLCVRLVRYEAPYDPFTPEICTRFSIRLLEAPHLITPRNNSDVTASPAFQWTAVPMGRARFAKYRLTLIELDPGQTNVSNAMKTNLPLIERESNLPVYQYRPSDPKLEKGHRYAWQVLAYDEMDRYSFKDDGQSEIWAFTYDPPVPPGFRQVVSEDEGKSTIAQNVNINPNYVFGQLTRLSGRLNATWYKSRIPKPRSVTIPKSGKGKQVTPGSSQNTPPPTQQQGVQTPPSQGQQQLYQANIGMFSMKEDMPMGGIHLKLYRRTRTEPMCAFYPFYHDGKMYDAEKLVATTTTNPDGTFEFKFFGDDSTGRILENAQIDCISGDLVGQVTGDLYRYYQIEVADPHLCSPSDEFKIQPGGSFDAGDLFSLVRSYRATIEVDGIIDEDKIDLSGMNVTVIRGSRPFDIPENEGILDPPEPTGFTKLGFGSSMIIGKGETDAEGFFTMHFLAKSVGPSDFYQVIVTSPEEGVRYYHPAMKNFHFGFLMDEKDDKGNSLKFDYVTFNEDYEPAEMHAMVYVKAIAKNPRISGEVYRSDNEGVPIVNTPVFLYKRMGIPVLMRTCKTDSKGGFVFDNLQPTSGASQYFIVINKAGYKYLRYPSTENGIVVEKGQKKHFSLKLEPALTVKGRLVDEFGRPVAGKVRIGNGAQVHTVKHVLAIPRQLQLSGSPPQNTIVQQSLVRQNTRPNRFVRKSKPSVRQVTYKEEFTTPAVPGLRRMYITPDNLESYHSDELWILLPMGAEDIGEFTVFRKAHRLAVRAVTEKLSSGGGSNPKGQQAYSSSMNQQQFSMKPPTYEPVIGARVRVNGMEPDSVDANGVSYFVWFSSGDLATIEVEGPLGSDYIAKEFTQGVPDDEPVWQELDVVLELGGALKGTVRVGTVPIPNARVLLYDNPAETDPLVAYTDNMGRYELHALPRGKHTFLAAKSKSPYIGDTAIVPINRGMTATRDFELKAYNDMDITSLLGFPIEVTAVDSSAGKVMLSGNFVEMPGNDQFVLKDTSATLAFSNVVIVPSGETNSEGLPYAQPETLPLVTLADEIEIVVFEHFPARQHDIVNGIHIVQPETRGEVRGAVSVNPSGFQFASGSLDFGMTQIALANDLVATDRLIVPSITSDGSKARDDPSGFYACMEDGSALQYTFYEFDCEVDSAACFFNGDTLILPTILHTNIQDVEVADLEIDIGSIRAHHDNVEDIVSTDDILIPLAGEWSMLGKSWSIDQNGLRLDSGYVDAELVQVPFTGLQILPDQIEYGSYNLDRISLSNTVVINFTADPYFVFDEGTKDWKIGASPDPGETSCGSIDALPGMDPTDKILIESFYVRSSGSKHFQPYYGNAVTLYKVASYAIDQLYPRTGYIEVAGSMDFGIPKLGMISVISTYAREGQEIVFRADPILETIAVNGVQIKFKSSGGDPPQWFDEEGWHANVDVFEDGAFRLASMVHHTPAKTELIVNEGEEVPVGTVKMADVEGEMHVEENDWTLFWFEGDLINNNQGGRLRFEVQGDIVANDQEIGVDQIETPFGDIALIYNFQEQQLEGTLHIEQDFSGTYLVGDATLLISGAGKGWYFFCGASFQLPQPKIDGTAAFAVGNFQLTQKQLDEFASYSYNNVGLPPQFHNFNGFFFEGTVKFPPPVFCPNFDFDFGLVSASLTCQVGANARFGMNFGPVNTYFVAMRAIGHLEAKVGASVVIACAGLKAGLLIEPGFEGMYQSNGTWYVQGDFPITLYGETYAGWGICDSDCEGSLCDKESLSASITLGILGYVGSDDKYFKFYFK